MREQPGTAVPMFRMRLTPMVKLLMIVMGVVYILELFVFHWSGSESMALAMRDQTFLEPEAVMFSGKLWQTFTYMFLHDVTSPFHLLFNLFMLWVFGSFVEERRPGKRFLWFFVVCGVGAGFVAAILGVLVPVLFGGYIVGASGAVLGLMIAFVMAYPEQKIYLFFMIPLKGKHLVWFTIAVDALSILSRQNVAVAAHLGGMLTAYLLISGRWRPSRWGKLFRRKKKHKVRPLRVVDADGKDLLN